MTDASSTADAELVTLRKAGWDEYQRYVAGLEGKVSAYERAAPATSDSAEVDGLIAAAPRQSAGHTALYVIGWVLFILQMLIVVGIMAMPLIAVITGAGVGGFSLWTFLGFALAGISVVVHVRFWQTRRPVALLLSGIFAPTFAWVGAIAFTVSLMPGGA